MRVISGSAKGRRLKSVPGDSTRPITDRVKVALFDILAPDLRDCLFLDLFAGTGGVGIEALSRGARRAVFVDIDPKSVQTIRDNLEITRLNGKSSVIRSDSFHYLDRTEREPFDIIYIAPPQYKGMWSRALQAIDHHAGWLSPDGIAVVQVDPKESREIPLDTLKEFDRRQYGSTLLWFFEKPGE